MSDLQRISITTAKIGMFVSDKTPGLKECGLNARGLISRESTLQKLQASGIEELYIDPSKGKSSPFALPIPLPPEQLKPKIKLEEERESAQSIYREARSLVSNLMSNAKMGKAIELGPVEELADEINNSVSNNLNALLCLSQIREKDQYLLEHSVNVGLLMSVFSRYLGFEVDERHQMVTGALLHDIGKIRVPAQILNKPGKLSGEEWEEMKNHVRYGEEVLMKSEGITPIALAICSQHHEKLDGSGYPRGLSDNKIAMVSRMASVVDIYDAITADRVYHQGKPPLETLKIMLDMAGTHLDKGLVHQFVNCMSLYPIGSMVELSNGRFAAVIQVNYVNANLPTVRTFYNTRSRGYETTKVIDLAKPSIELQIVSVQDPKEFNINIQDFI